MGRRGLSATKKDVLSAFEKGYRVSTDGLVLSPHGTRISLSPASNGYLKFSIKTFDQRRTNIFVHHLIAYQKFGDGYLCEGVQVRHLNNNAQDNRWKNISVGSCRDNYLDRTPASRRALVDLGGEARRNTSDVEVHEVFRRHHEGQTYRTIATALGMSKSQINYILKKANYTRAIR